MNAAAAWLCRDCGASSQDESAARAADGRCLACGSPRTVAHPELFSLDIAHIDCDAFYAAVEKRDNPSLLDKPVIIGGGRRGVVSTACYIARIYGVRSAMPMFQALKACPDAVVLRPDMAKYSAVGRQVRQLMQEVTPVIEPLSIDEAYLDLGARLPIYANPASALATLARRIEASLGITVSIGLGPNKFLAKIASDLDKPRGFAVIGRGDAADFLAPKRVGVIWGVGEKLAQRLAADGITTIAQLRKVDEQTLIRRYGSMGARLALFARGEDDRRVAPRGAPKSISVETTFETDTADPSALSAALSPLCRRLAERLFRAGYAAESLVLKLKTADFQTLTRTRTLAHPTMREALLREAAESLLAGETGAVAFRLIGVGAGRLVAPEEADPPDLLSALEKEKPAPPQQSGLGSSSSSSSTADKTKSP
ncbi:MAG: DNA polymerase IV [Rhodospirillaceae bacterium]|nr:DNA polymerase IV [Rhodospirillaceae bacterium]